MNASGRLNTCKSWGSMTVAIQLMATGKRVRNTYTTFLLVENSPGKLGLIPHGIARFKVAARLSLKDWFAPYQLVGGVTAHQGYDGYLV